MNESFNKAKAIAKKLVDAGATQCLVVGGWVRDHILGIESKDLDIEIYGLNYDQIVAALSPDFHVDLVGKSFGVVKVDNWIDVSIPRRENKNGVGHKGFDIQIDPDMTVKEAAIRRDFTVNSIAMRFNGEFVDPFSGRVDLERKVLRACSNAFREDPLRVLRGMQFAARFGFTMDAGTILMCKDLLEEYDTIAKERVFDEWKKWATKGKYPKLGLDILYKTNWIEKYPVLKSMVETPQDPIWHPEGDVFVHTGHVCNVATDIAERENLDENDRLILLFSALCHDMGKPSTTVRNNEDRWIAPKHADVGVALAQEFLTRINGPSWLTERVRPLVREHMAHVSHSGGDPSDRTIRRLANRLAPATMRLWAMVCEADASGRPPLPRTNPVEHWVRVANRLAIEDQRPKPILMGRHLLSLGMKPGKEMGAVLTDAFERQLDGDFSDLAGAITWVKTRLAKKFSDL